MAKKTSFLILSTIIFVTGLVSVNYKPSSNKINDSSVIKLNNESPSATASIIGGDNTKAVVNQNIEVKTNLTPGVGDTTKVKE